MFILNDQNSVANQFLRELRSTSLQGDRLRFRRNLERLGEIMAYEISKGMNYSTVDVDTPLTSTVINVIQEQPVIIPVLRAAIPFFQGVVNYFDHADCGFIGAYRREGGNETLEIDVDLGYVAVPSIEGKEVLIVDPMLATGKSFISSIDSLFKHGRPSKIHIVSVIAAPEGIAYIQENLSAPHKFWLCALDEKLDEKFYIFPGLGDAGDLAFGSKL